MENKWKVKNANNRCWFQLCVKHWTRCANEGDVGRRKKKGVCALLSRSLWNSLLNKGFISIKADKTSNARLKNSPGVSTAKWLSVFIFWRQETIKTKMIAGFWKAVEHNETAATSGTKPVRTLDSFFFFDNSFYHPPTKKKKEKKERPSFSINEAGNWVWGPAGSGLTTMAWGPNPNLRSPRRCEEILIQAPPHSTS